MVSAGQPESAETLHPLEADQDILKSVVKRMTHMKLTCDVRGRHHDSVGFFVLVDLSVKKAALFPETVDPILEFTRVIGFCEFFFHFSFLRL